MTDQELQAALMEHTKEVIQSISVLMEAEFKPRFDLLAENQKIMMEKLEALEGKADRMEEKIDDLDASVQMHTSVLKTHTKDIDKLKKAQ